MSLRLLLAVAVALPAATTVRGEPVVLVSFDGFRHDYLRGANVTLPAFERLAREGARVDELVNIFPTKTFPNHYTLVTGRYAESHGIVDNRMWDDELQEYFNMSSCGTWWDLAEPAWLTAIRGSLKSAAYWWPGSDCAVQGQRPTYSPRSGKFNASVPFFDRVDEALGWLALPPAERPTFVALYFEEPDTAGHIYGPDSPELRQALTQKADATLQRLLDGLDRLQLTNAVNIIVTSDHGMTATSEQRTLYFEDYNVTRDLVDFVTLSPVAALRPLDPKDTDLVFDRLRALPNARAYRKDAPAGDADGILDRWHLRAHRRVMPILVVADEGYSLGAARADGVSHCCGTHGYDNALPSMHPLLLARGPSIRRDGFVLDRMLSVDVYPFVCRLLGVTAAAGHNGTDTLPYTALLALPDEPSGGADLAVALVVIALVGAVGALLAYRRYARGPRSK